MPPFVGLSDMLSSPQISGPAAAKSGVVGRSQRMKFSVPRSLVVILSCLAGTAVGASTAALASVLPASGGVTILKAGTETQVFLPQSDTDVARGAALMLAWASFGAGESMFIGPGTYEVNGSTEYLLSGYPGQTVAGAGMDVTIVKMGDRGVGAAPLYALFDWYARTPKGGANHVTVRDLTLDGNLQNQSSPLARAAGIYGFGSHFLVERVHTINFGSKGAVSENFTIFLGGSGHGPDFGNSYDCVIRDCVADQAWGISTLIGSGINPFIIAGQNISANTLTIPPAWRAISTSSSGATTTVTTSVPHQITPASPVTIFDGSAVFFTTDSASNVLTLHGATVTPEVVGGLLQISGGSNFVPGFYGIDAQNGTTVTLRKPAATAAATGGKGAIVPVVHASLTIRGHSLAQVNGTWLPQVTGPDTFVIPVASSGGTGGEVIEESGWVFGAKILNCTVRNIGSGPNQPPFVHGTGFSWVADGEIANCTFENLVLSGSGIYEDTGAIYGHRYHSNRFVNCTLPIRLTINGQPAITDLDIFNNDITMSDSAATEAITIYPYGVIGTDVRIRANRIRGASSFGIVLGRLDGVLIEDNIIDVGQQAIVLYDNVTNVIQRRNKTSGGAVVGTALELWRAAKFGDAVDNPVVAGDAADPDFDGLRNLLEYAFGLDPNVPDRANLLFAMESPDSVSVTYRKALAATDIVWVIEQTGSLDGSWTTASAVQEIVSNDGVIQHIKATISVGEAAQLWLRLKVQH